MTDDARPSIHIGHGHRRTSTSGTNTPNNQKEQAMHNHSDTEMTKLRARRRHVLPIAGLGCLGAMVAIGASGAADAATAPQVSVASGSVAALSGSSMEVQNPNTGQVTVNWSSSTASPQNTAVTETAVTAGDCVTVTGSSSKKSKNSVVAQRVSISHPTSSGSCQSGFGGGPSRPPSGSSGHLPGGGFGGFGGRAPSSGNGGPPAGFGRGRGSGSIALASGKVTHAVASEITVSGFSSASSGRRPSRNRARSSRPKTTTIHVSVTSSTTYSETNDTTASTVAVGNCVTAIGRTGSTGAISASTVRITSATTKSCGAGGFGGGGFPGA